MPKNNNIEPSGYPDKEVAVIYEAIHPIVARSQSLTIDSPQSLTDATMLLSELNTYNDRLIEEREKVTVPLNEALKAERARWKPIETPILAAIDAIRSKMGDYKTITDKEAAAKAASITARVAPGKGNLSAQSAIKKLEEIEKAPDEITTDAGSVKFRKVPIVKVVKFDLIPLAYFDLNETRLLAALKLGHTVPGALLDEKQIPLNSR